MAVCPHCSQDSSEGGARCEHWLCSASDDIVEHLVKVCLTPDYDPQKLEQHHRRYAIEIGKWAIEAGTGWFTRTPEAEKMKRRLQQSMTAMAMSLKLT